MDEENRRSLDETIGRDVARARDGDRDALEAVACAVQREIFVLAQRFLWHPQDAEDATQEILIRVITGLQGFRGESGFRTWVYRVACNALLTMRRQRMEAQSQGFEAFGEDLARGLSDAPTSGGSDPEASLLLEEVKIGCTLAMLLCLDRDHRLAYILGEILEMDHHEAAEALGTTPAAFRKRLSRARADVVAFVLSRCGLANPSNPCRCRRRVATAVALGRVDPGNLLFASSREQARGFPGVLAEIRKLEATRRAAAIYRSHPDPQPSQAFPAWLRKILDERAGTLGP